MNYTSELGGVMNEFPFWIESRVEREGKKKKGKKKNVHCSRTIVFKSVYKGGNGISLLPEIGFV